MRVCQPTYSKERIQNHGIEVLDWEFSDGHPPPDVIVEKWLALIKDYFWVANTAAAITTTGNSGKASTTEKQVIRKGQQQAAVNEKAIAIHCVSGLGRAPVLVGLALLEAGMNCEDVIFLIRKYK